ncbi:MAG: glutamine--tRNA ligase, partial [Fimbriimonadaceae bacterium]
NARDDYRAEPPPKYFRQAPGREVRLRYGNFLRCASLVHDEAGNVVEVHCTYDPETRGGNAPDGRKVKATLHWVEASTAAKAHVRLYDHLFQDADPDEGGDWLGSLNPESLRSVEAWVEPSVPQAAVGTTFQFERLGYFTLDKDSGEGSPVFNRSVTLRDTWAKVSLAASPAP